MQINLKHNIGTPVYTIERINKPGKIWDMHKGVQVVTEIVVFVTEEVTKILYTIERVKDRNIIRKLEPTEVFKSMAEAMDEVYRRNIQEGTPQVKKVEKLTRKRNRRPVSYYLDWYKNMLERKAEREAERKGESAQG